MADRSSLVWHDSEDDRLERHNLQGDAVNIFVAQTSARYYNDYVPFLEGMLSSEYEIGVEDGRGYIDYIMPYAQAMYYGVSKYGTPFEYTKSFHPKATSYWDKAALEVHESDITEETQNFIERGGR